MIRLLLVDDQSIVREGLASLLQVQPDLEIVGEAENGKIAIDLAIASKPDVVLMDLRMPVMDGIAATEIISREIPEIKTLVLTTFDDDELVVKAMKAGAKGYLLKDTPSAELADGIRAVYRGYTQLAPGLFEKAIAGSKQPNLDRQVQDKIDLLTEREREVLQLIASGYSNQEIATELYIAERTVKNHVNSILRSLDLRDRTQAAIFAHKYLYN